MQSKQLVLFFSLLIVAVGAYAQFQRPALAPAPMPLEIKPDGEWRGIVGAGFTATTGNTRSVGANFLLDAARATSETKFTLTAQGLYAENRNLVLQADGTTRQENVRTADQARLGVRNDWNSTSNPSYVFASASGERDAVKQLQLRSTVGSGVGYRLLQGSERTFEVFTGLGVRQDRYDAPGQVVNGSLVRSYRAVELMLGEESALRLTENTSWQQRLMIFPNLENRGEVRATFETLLSVAMSRNISLTVSLSDRYDSQAVPPVKSNDVLLFTGLNLRLGPR